MRSPTNLFDLALLVVGMGVVGMGVVAIGSQARADESMRCGTWIVTSEATVQELTSKCGEPASKDISTADVYAAGPQPNRTRKVGVTTTERWTYDRGPQAFRMIVTIVDGKLKSIDRAQ
jgi:hypothetical protein